jgi:hypothetical protein
MTMMVNGVLDTPLLVTGSVGALLLDTSSYILFL